MKFTIRIIIMIFISINMNCTGWNFYRWATGSSAHVSPTPEYTNPNSILKGGLVIHRNTIPGAIGVNQGGQMYRGESCSWSAMWLVAGGDSSLKEAKKNGKIDIIHSVEYKQEAVMGFFYHNFCTIVVGTKEVPNAD